MNAILNSASKTKTAAVPQRSQWRRERDDIVRGASGGFLFGIPLLYTMEVWWIGASATPLRLLGVLAITFVLVLLLNRTAGFRRFKDIRLIDAAIDSVEAQAIGLVCAAATLTLMRKITLDVSLGAALGKLIFEAMPFSIGVALANQFLRKSQGDDQSQQQGASDDDQGAQSRLNATLADMGATAIGSIIIAFNIAPTDEIPMLTAAVSPFWLLLLIAASLLISYGIVFAADFADQQQRRQQQGIFQQPLSETLMSYLVSLAAAALMLWFFQKLSVNDPWQMWLSYTLVLGLPATVGGAAGRLAI
jgi:putative integral membrane protein (TIGR02587 family)